MKKFMAIVMSVLMCLSVLSVGSLGVSAKSTKSANKGFVVKYKYNYNGSKGIKNSILKGTYDINKLFSFYYNGKKINYDGKKLKCTASSKQVSIKGKNIIFKVYDRISLKFLYRNYIKYYAIYSLADVKKKGHNKPFSLSKSEKELFMKYIWNFTFDLDKKNVNNVLFGSETINNYKQNYSRSFKSYMEITSAGNKAVPTKFKKKGMELVKYLCKGNYYSNISIFDSDYLRKYVEGGIMKYCVKDKYGRCWRYYYKK